MLNAQGALIEANFERYVQSPSEQSEQDSLSAALSREGQLFSAFAAGVSTSLTDAFSDDLPETGVKLLGSAALGYGMARILPTKGITSSLVRAGSGAMLLAMGKDLMLDGGAVCTAVGDAWHSGDRMASNTTVMSSKGGKLAIDIGLMTAGGLGGDALARMRTSSALVRSPLECPKTHMETAVPTEQVLLMKSVPPPESIVGSVISERSALQAKPVWAPAPSTVRVESGTQATEKQIIDKIEELNRLFRISISEGGVQVLNPWSSPVYGNYSLSAKLHTRLPTWTELEGLEAALQRSLPSTLGGQQLRFTFYEFPKKLTYQERQSSTGAVFFGNKIHFKPGSRTLPAVPNGETPAHWKYSLQALATHEIAHNGQLNNGLFNDDVLAPFVERLGWSRVKVNGVDTWAFEAAGGQLYRFDSAKDRWLCLDPRYGGAPRSPKDPPSLTSDDMRKRAAIRPISDYFDIPIEMVTEGTMFFRMGAGPREWLAAKSKPLYSVVKELDEREILRQFKPRSSQPKLTRNLDGRLEPETPELRDFLKLLE